ncbi:MAG: DUF4142 domain-containing protein [Acidobacteria bacterium]|nr:DUF4142 domain-containing protein [Acidobacteriota bacterium]
MLRLKQNILGTAAFAVLAVAFGCSGPANSDRPTDTTSQPAKATSTADRSDAGKILDKWPNRPVLAARQMMAQYGEPQEVTSEKLVWHNEGPYKRIVVTKLEIPHDFPKPHMDYLAHTIDYRAPADKASALVDFDGSVIVDRTAGEMTARCDLEGHNILTLNLAHDIVTGKTDAAQARKSFGEYVVQDALGNYPKYVTALQFQPMASPADPGSPIIPGSPKRAVDGAVGTSGTDNADGEVLGFVGAVDENEILAAAEVAKKKVGSEVKDYATMLHKAHGQHLADTMKLGQKIGVSPVETADVDKLRVKGAGNLASLISLDDDKFERGYLDAMVKGHTEVIEMIDNQLLKTAKNPELQAHLKATRDAVTMHLEQAKKLQSDSQR